MHLYPAVNLQGRARDLIVTATPLPAVTDWITIDLDD